MSTLHFENTRWSHSDQTPEFRHRACLGLLNEGTVLDIGCGDGLMLELLRTKDITGTGLDLSDEAVRKCREKGLDAQQFSFDDALSFSENAFDYVVLLDVLEHVYDPDRLLAEAARVARRGVVVSVPNFSSLPARLQVLVGSIPENNRPNKGHVYWFNWGVLGNLAKQSGLSLASIRMNTFFPASLLGNSLPKVWPNLFALSFVGLYHKKRDA